MSLEVSILRDVMYHGTCKLRTGAELAADTGKPQILRLTQPCSNGSSNNQQANGQRVFTKIATRQSLMNVQPEVSAYAPGSMGLQTGMALSKLLHYMGLGCVGD